MIYTIYTNGRINNKPCVFLTTTREKDNTRYYLSLDAARWSMVKDAISHGYTWVVVKYV